MSLLSASDEVKQTQTNKVQIMQIFFKTRNAARAVKSGKIQDNWQGLPEHLKGVNNGIDSVNRWGRVIDIQKKEKQQISLKCVKDWRNIENAKNVQVLKVKKLKELRG